MVEKQFVLVVLAGEGILLGGFLFFAYKVYQDRRRIGMPVLRMLLVAVICLITWLLVVTLHPLQVWQRLVGVGSVQYGTFLYYMAVKQMFTRGRPQSLIRDKAFWMTALVVGMIMVLDILLRGQPAFDSPDAYTPSVFFYTEAILFYTSLVFWDILIVKVYLQALQRTTHLIDQSRFGLCVLAYFINLLGLLLVEVNLLLSLLKHEEYRVLMNSLYHVTVYVMVVFVPLSYILPNAFFVRVLRPLSAYKTFRQKRQQALLRSLHQTMVRIVPGVQLSWESVESVRDLRILIEISDARQMIWSLQQRLKPVTPREEAKYLLHLLNKNTVLTTPGAYSPAPTSLKNVIKHNVIVAKRLQCLQRSA